MRPKSRAMGYAHTKLDSRGGCPCCRLDDGDYVRGRRLRRKRERQNTRADIEDQLLVAQQLREDEYLEELSYYDYYYYDYYYGGDYA